MNGILKGMLMMLVIMYVVSPLDACPGIIDDVIVVMLSMAAQKRIGTAD